MWWNPGLGGQLWHIRGRGGGPQQMRLASVRDSEIPASVPRLRAAWPDVAVPSTWWPELSKASATAVKRINRE